MNDHSFLISVIYSCVAGTLGTGLGGLLAYGIKPSNTKMLSLLMSFSAGVMLAVVIFSLVPESLEMTTVWVMILFLAIGVCFMMFCENIIPHTHATQTERLSWLLFFGIAMHNIPEGLAIGAGMNTQDNFGIMLALLIMLHNIPEGLAMSLPLRVSGKNPVPMALLAGLPTVLGAAVGKLLGGISAEWIGCSLAFAGGAMAYLSIMDLIPESASVGGYKKTLLSALIGLAAGFLLITVI